MTTGPTGTPPQQPGPSALDTFLQGAKGAAVQARTQVAQTTQANRGKISSALDKLVRTVDDKTGRKYHSQVESAKGWVEKGVDVVAGGPASPGATGAPGTAAPSTTSSPTASAASSSVPPVAPASPSTPVTPPSTTPTPAPDKPKEGWHRGPDGQWTRTS
ncbi:MULTISPECIES: antitoxin [Arsenicicoccus]|uniref:antitoxin n=1 Tax=Arsenicicoccus TaxID=267408 RepID=UPI0003121A03|nr:MULTISPECIES: antitoxin [Arsenicicoccus]